MKKIIKITLSIFLLVILPALMPIVALMTGITSTALVIIVITLVTIALVMLSFKKKKKVQAIYFLILGIVVGYSAFTNITFNKIIFEGKKLTFSERTKRMEDIDLGKVAIEDLTVKYIRNKRLSKFDSKIVKGNKTFHYKSEVNSPNKSIEFIEDTLSKSMDGYGKYLGYKEEKSSEIFLSNLINGELRGKVDASNQIELGMYEEYIDGGKFAEDGLEIYKKIIIHEYAHFIQGTYVRNDEVFALTPSWFNEGVATYVANEICNVKDERGEIPPLDLSKTLNESRERYSDYYISSSRVIREIYKELGAEGIVSILKLSTEVDFDKALKEVTGKQLEDYYYIFKG